MAPTCCAVDCVHNAKNSNCKLKKFPSDPVRAKQWENNIRRDRWERKSWHVICTCHFDDSQWDQRLDGPKLKPNAQPLLFETHLVAGQGQPASKRRKHQKDLPVVTDPPDPQEVAAAVPGGLNANGVVRQMIAEEAQNKLEEIVQPEIVENFGENGESSRKTFEVDGEVGIPTPVITTPQRNLEKELEELKAKFESKTRAEHELWKELQKNKRDLAAAEAKVQKLTSSISTLYNEDQLLFLATGRVKQWSKQTMKKALQLRFAVGVSGYSYLLEQGHPYPSYSSICRRVQKVPTDCGVSSYTIDLMALKAPSFNRPSRMCILSLDEMELTDKTEFDLGTRKLVGNITLGDTSKKASKLLLLVARGVSVKWKQVIGWHLTDGHTAKGEHLWQFIKEGLEKMEGADYFVIGAVSDMGPSNQAIWAYLGIKPGCFTIPHPARSSEPFYWFADVPHLLKNLRSGLLKYDFALPQDVAEESNLPTDLVSKQWILKLIALENDPNCVFKAAPHLNKKQITDPTHFETMKVVYAQTFFSEETAVAIEVAVNMGLLPKEALTTAWFCRQTAKWYTTMTSRHVTKSVTVNNFERKTGELKKFADIAGRIVPQSDKKLKPYQRGIVVSTLNMIELARRLLFVEKCLRYFLGSRLTQDALENIFSVLRSRGCIMPTPLQALRAVRLVTVAQFTRDVRGSSYDQAEDTQYLDFLQSPKKSRKVGDCGPSVAEGDSAVMIPILRPMEADALDHFTGHAVFKCLGYACNGCKTFVVQEERTGAQKTMLADKGGLTYPSELAILAGRQMEAICQSYMKQAGDNFFDVILRKAYSSVIGTFLPVCTCTFAKELCLKFIRSRVYFALKNDHVHYLVNKKKEQQTKAAASKAVIAEKAARRVEMQAATRTIFASKSGNATKQKHL